MAQRNKNEIKKSSSMVKQIQKVWRSKKKKSTLKDEVAEKKYWEACRLSLF